VPPFIVVAALPLGASSCSWGRHLQAPNPFSFVDRVAAAESSSSTYFFPLPVPRPGRRGPPPSAGRRRGRLRSACRGSIVAPPAFSPAAVAVELLFPHCRPSSRPSSSSTALDPRRERPAAAQRRRFAAVRHGSAHRGSTGRLSSSPLQLSIRGLSLPLSATTCRRPSSSICGGPPSSRRPSCTRRPYAPPSRPLPAPVRRLCSALLLFCSKALGGGALLCRLLRAGCRAPVRAVHSCAARPLVAGRRRGHLPRLPLRLLRVDSNSSRAVISCSARQVKACSCFSREELLLTYPFGLLQSCFWATNCFFWAYLECILSSCTQLLISLACGCYLLLS